MANEVKEPLGYRDVLKEVENSQTATVVQLLRQLVFLAEHQRDAQPPAFIRVDPGYDRDWSGDFPGRVSAERFRVKAIHLSGKPPSGVLAIKVGSRTVMEVMRAAFAGATVIPVLLVWERGQTISVDDAVTPTTDPTLPVPFRAYVEAYTE